VVNRAVDPQSPAELTDAERRHPDRLDARLLRIAGVCVIASVMSILDTTVVSVAQRTFIEKFDSTQAVVAWTMTGYSLALATVIPLTGWAADRLGTKRLFMGSILAFTAGSLLCAAAPNIDALIGFRVLQGLAGGMLMPLGFTILTHEAGPKRLGRLMAVLSFPMLLGPICGPIVGGWLIDSYGWQWIFGINLPIGVITFVLAAVVFPKDRPSPSETFDFKGMLLLSPGLATFLYGVSSLPARGTVTDRHVLIPVVIGAALVGGFVVHALNRADHPLINLRLFSNRVFTLANSAMFVYGAAFFGAGLLFPSYLQQVLHQTPYQSGVHMIPQSLGAMLTMPLAGTFMDKRGPGKAVLVGLALIAAGMGLFAYGAWAQTGYRPTLLAGLVTLGLGMGSVMTPLSGSAMQALGPHEIARGSTLISVNFQVAGSVGTALMSVILTNQFNRSPDISMFNQLAARKAVAARQGVRLDPSAIPPRALAPDFTTTVLHELSRAYTVVFVVAVALVMSTYLPALFLPRKQVVPAQAPEPLL
jgi:EmrB/QacA subfamily drug resistance transporter